MDSADAPADRAGFGSALLRERLHLYESNVWSACAGQLVVALLVLWVFGASAGTAALGAWLLVFGLSLATRFVVGSQLRRARESDQPPSRALLRQARLAVAASGATWGLAGVLFFPAGDLQSQTLLAFVLAGMAAGSLTLTAFDLAGALLFAALALMPLSLKLFAEGGSAPATMATMVLLFVGFLGLTGWRAQRNVRETVLAREAESRRAESLLDNQRRLQEVSAELRRQSEALAVTLDSMDQGILSLDETGRTHFYNRRLSELLDIPESFFAGRPLMEEIARYQLEQGHYGKGFGLVDSQLRSYLEGWFAGDQGQPFPPNYLRRTPSGRTLEVKTRYLPGSGMVRTFADVTAFFEARERLLRSQAQESKLALVAAHTDNAVVITDAEDRIEWVNEAFTRMTGRTLADAAGQRRSELLRGAAIDLDALARMDEQLQREQKSAGELRCRLDDGRTLWLAIETHAVLGEDGAAQHYISIGRDVSERHATEEALRKARDEAERASRAKSEFLSAMSHELRTPMNAILGFAQLLEIDAAQPLPERQRGHVQQILRAGAHLLELINDVLDLTRVEAGKQLISIEPVPIGPLLEECLALMRPLAAERAIRVEGGDAVDIECTVAADRTRLRQVLLNLLSNAIKYNRTGGEVRVRCEIDDDSVRLGIADTGQGLAPEQRERLFMAFERLGAEDGPVPGAGIGLALSKRMLELMDGAIEVESEAGQGSTFWVRLRRPQQPTAASAASAPAPLAAADPDADATATRHVLYIEDNPVNVLLMEAALEREPGVHLVTAPLPELGLDLARADRPDLILLDIQLPGMDGFEVLRRLRAVESTRDIPVVAVSANAMRGDVERALAAGFDGYLTKPLDFDQLLARVRGAHPRRAGERPSAAAS